MTKQTHTTTTPDGITLHYETHNTPTPSHPSLILLHYYGGSPQTFSPLLTHPPLAPFHKILYHARGWSPSTSPPSQIAYSIPNQSSDLPAIITANHLTTDFILIAHSMGAKVAQYYAATHPSSALKGLVLVAPAPLRGLSLSSEMKAQQQAAYQSAEGVRFVLEHVLTAGPGALSEEVVEQCVRDSMRGDEGARRAWPEFVAEEDYGGLEERVGVPVLVLRGDRDFEREVVGELGVEWGWRSRVVEGCGHLIPLERPERLGREVVEFCGGVC